MNGREKQNKNPKKKRMISGELKKAKKTMNVESKRDLLLSDEKEK